MKINNEIKIGIMVVISLAILAILFIKTGNFSLKKDGYHLKAHFRNIDGVNENSPVMFNGLEVGVVERVNIKETADETIMELVLYIDSKARPREGSKAFVKNLGFMGEKYVAFTSGEKSKPYLKPDSIILGIEPPSFDHIIREGEDIAVNLKEISQNVNERLKKNAENIDSILTNVNESTEHISSITKNVDERLKVNKDHLDDIAKHLSVTAKNLEELSYDLKLNPWKLLYREKTKR